MSKEELKSLAGKLMFDMKDDEYETLLKEFDVILKEMDKISEFKNIENIEPMFHPFLVDVNLREDEALDFISTEEALLNVKEKIGSEVKVPKVVGE